MRVRAALVAAVAAATLVAAGCSSDSDSGGAADAPASTPTASASATESDAASPTVAAASDPDAPVCSGLRAISEADAETRDPNVATWEQQRDLILGGAEANDAAYGEAIAASTDPAVTADLETVRDFTTATIDAVRNADSFETFGSEMGTVDPTGATEASLRLNDYSTATCGFPLSSGG